MRTRMALFWHVLLHSNHAMTASNAKTHVTVFCGCGKTWRY